MKTIPFDLELYTNNPDKYEIQTKDGRKIDEIHHFKNVLENEYCIGAVVEQELQSYKKTGKYYEYDDNHNQDLVLVEKPKTVYLALFYHQYNEPMLDFLIFDTKERLKNHLKYTYLASANHKYVKYIEFDLGELPQ